MMIRFDWNMLKNLKSALLLLLVISSSATAQEVILLQQGSGMRYLANTADPGIGTSWTVTGFDDASWTPGTYGIGYDTTDPLAGMIQTPVPACRSIYTRAHFTALDLAAVQTLHLGADYDDGYAAWINGVLVKELNMPAGPPLWDTSASGNHESSNGDTATYDTVFDITSTGKSALVQGDNVLAIGIWNVNSTSSDLALVPLLSINRPPPVSGTPVCGTLAGNTRWTLAQSPYTVTCDVIIPKGSTLTIDAGVQVLFAGGTGLTVNGQIHARGTSGQRIIFTRNQGGAWNRVSIDQDNDGESRQSELEFVDLAYSSTLLDVAMTGNSPILVEDCRFDHWSGVALHWDTSHGLRVRRCEFGLSTPLSEANHETVNGYRAGAVVEHCTFGRRRDYNDVIDLGDTSWGEPVPTLRYNTFLGGDDDAIDFDGSAGWIIGNLVMDHWPRPGASSKANGGGITGNDLSDPVVIGNIVYHCYHGIGYKNGTAPLILNNLVINCHVGVTFYKDDCAKPPPRPVLFNNLIWNNHDAVTGAPQNVVLDGKWFPEYCQTEDVQAVIDLRYSIVEGGWPGEGNLDGDPLIADPENGDFSLASSLSPAIDSAYGGPFSKAGVNSADLAAALARDRLGNSRADLDCADNTGAGAIPYLDRGPLEALATLCGSALPRFIRGDANGDKAVDIADPVRFLLAIFKGISNDCQDALDANDDGFLDTTDAVYLLHYLFTRGAAPPAPFPAAEGDLTEDPLVCQRF